MNWIAVRAAVAVAAVYGYFLIFAQFSFVELLRAGGVGPTLEKSALGVMAATGIAGGVMAAWRGAAPVRIRAALGAAACAAVLAPLAATPAWWFGVAAITGAALGAATVGLSALLPCWCTVAWVGLGTGLGYAACNLPAVFQQPAPTQAWLGAGFALAGMLAVPPRIKWLPEKPNKIFPAWGALAIFTALVWLDSAAFFIIQHTTDLKATTWAAGMLWRNAALHLGVAAAAGLWLARGAPRSLPALACGLLAVAALTVNEATTRGLAGWFYPAGVSLYSTALVAWPGWFSGADGVRPAAWRAAGLFAVAGWMGSANGIGMAESLHLVPPWFVALAGSIVIGITVLTDIRHWRPALAVAAVIGLAMAYPVGQPASPATTIERGRQVYLDEGCIHCHSQYVRPGSPDEAIWGPAGNAAKVLQGKPVLIGNRRQGPDLTNVGARRSATWLKVHFINPQALAPDSSMPAYAHLFKDSRGDDLIHYLKASGMATTPNLLAQAARWQPAASTAPLDAKPLFATHCAACHGPQGRGNGPLANTFARPPANLADGPFTWTNTREALDLRVAQVIKFGLPGTDMPGHETLTDSQVTALAKYVLEWRRLPLTH